MRALIVGFELAAAKVGPCRRLEDRWKIRLPISEAVDPSVVVDGSLEIAHALAHGPYLHMFRGPCKIMEAGATKHVGIGCK